MAEKQLYLGKRVKLQAGLQAYISLHCVEASSLVISTSTSNLTIPGSDLKPSGLVLPVSDWDSKTSSSNLTVSGCDSKPSDCSDSTSGSCLATEKPDETSLVLKVSGCDSRPYNSDLTASGCCDSKPSSSNVTVYGYDTKPSGLQVSGCDLPKSGSQITASGCDSIFQTFRFGFRSFCL